MNKQEDICALVFFWCQDEFFPNVGNNAFTGNCPGRTWCKTFEERLPGQLQPSQQGWGHILGEVRKAASPKDLAGTMGQELLNFKFSLFQRTIFLCWTRPALSQTGIAVLIVLVLHPSASLKILHPPFFFIKRKTDNKCCHYYKHGSDVPSASDRRILCRISQSGLWGGSFVRRLSRMMSLCLCQQHQQHLPAVAGPAAFSVRISVSDASSLESEAWMLLFKP